MKSSRGSVRTPSELPSGVQLHVAFGVVEDRLPGAEGQDGEEEQEEQGFRDQT